MLQNVWRTREMFRHKWLFNLTLLLSLLLLIALAVLGSPARAQQLSKASNGKLPIAVQSYIADMGEHSPFVQSLLKRQNAPATVPSKATSPEASASVCGTWSVVPTQNLSDFNQLWSVASDKDNLWAVGQYCYSGCDS